MAVLAGLATPLSGGWPWAAKGVAATAALLTGGPMTAGLLALADAHHEAGVTARAAQPFFAAAPGSARWSGW